MGVSEPQIFGVLGSDISYSLSPRIFKMLFDKFSLPHGYHIFDIKARDLERFVDSARFLGFTGFNVTVPFKCEIIPCLDRLDSTAKACQSVNLVVRRKQRLIGYNTDILGIDRVFRQYGIRSLNDKRAILIGAGGTARAALSYFLGNRPAVLTIVNRTVKRLKKMLLDLGIPADSNGIEAYDLPGLKGKLRELDFDIIFNATPLATGKLISLDQLDRRAVVFEAAYSDNSSKHQSKIRRIGGIDMLIFQALRGFELFTGIEIENYARIKATIKRKISN